MSTRSMLCIKQSDGSLKAMFKHWDGYPSFMMPFLDEFNSDELANELVRFGGCESFQTPEDKQLILTIIQKISILSVLMAITSFTDMIVQ